MSLISIRVAISSIALNHHIYLVTICVEREPLLGNDLASTLFVNNKYATAGIHARNNLFLAGREIPREVVVLLVSQATDSHFDI